MHTADYAAFAGRLGGLGIGVPSGAMRPASVRTYTSGAEIYAEGDRAGELYVVEFGAVRIHRLLADGRRQVIAFHLAGEIFGFEPGATRSFFAEAINATGLKPLSSIGADAAELMPLALRGLLRAQEHLLVIGRQCAMERIAAFFLDMAERQGDEDIIELPMPRLDIADYLGLTIETVSRTFAKMRSSGLISLQGTRTVRLAKRELLQDLCR
ncbi:helix-turn-helix domain-containing protein [Gellertiella hungarica]|uniref:CRP/FNR family nitrogen fixation transcriptional regulator n=1 Tax=Gellertiella hungarica TaxID=1572859 RepID=A0A7W6JB66_9HYPH|nr:helix-turn-helix domain-containing protein [Gellertiella hungarica]MBB4067233.1 CRP/FNR family nitrogen fixation transcriptional regulator [Gellertiella hungarica]